MLAVALTLLTIGNDIASGGAGMVRVRDAEDLAALLDVVGAAEQDVDLLEADAPRLGHEEVDEDGEQDVGRHEEEEALEPLVVEEDGEELLEDGVADVLHLRAHADGLGAHVDREHLGRPDPRRRAPRRLVEEGEEEQREDDGDPDGLRLGPVDIRRLEHDHGDDHHAYGHADGADDEEESSAVSVGRPGGVEGKDDAKGGVECVD